MLQAVQCCRWCGVAGGEQVPPLPLGWYFLLVIIKILTQLSINVCHGDIYLGKICPSKFLQIFTPQNIKHFYDTYRPSDILATSTILKHELRNLI